MSKKTIRHAAFQYHDPITGEYNEDVNPEGEIEVTLGNYSVCPSCNGHGTHFRNDLCEQRMIDIIMEDGDEDGLRYYNQGYFDQMCDECNGKRVVREIFYPEWAEEQLNSWYDCAMESARISAAERRMGA